MDKNTLQLLKKHLIRAINLIDSSLNVNSGLEDCSHDNKRDMTTLRGPARFLCLDCEGIYEKEEEDVQIRTMGKPRGTGREYGKSQVQSS